MLLERDTELDQLRRLVEDLDSSGGRVVLVRGEAGIGKTALISKFTDEIASEAHVLLGVCDDLLTPQPLGPIWDVDRQESSLLGSLSSGDRREIMESLLGLLSRRLRPTVLVFEDMQWADEATLDVTKFLGRRIGRTNGLLVLTYRDGEVDTDHPLRMVIGDLPPQSVERVQLGPLSMEAIAEMVGGTDLDVDEVATLTDGNPLFVTEVSAWGMDRVPASVRDSVLARAAKLPAVARRFLDLVSVIPGGAKRTVVEAILDPSPEEVVACERLGLLRFEDDTVSFSHELVRRAIESELSTEDRRCLNQKVLDEIAERADPAVLVHHAREAGDDTAIIELAPRAARAALALESHRDALRHFQTLEPYLDRLAEVDRAALLEDRARTEYYLDEREAPDTIDRAIDLYRSAGSERALARALAFATRLHAFEQPRDAEACSVEAVALLEKHGPSADLAFAVSQQAWLALMQGSTGRAAELADLAIGIADGVDAQLAVIHSQNTQGCVLLARGDRAGFAVLEECHRRAEKHGFPAEAARALNNMSGFALQFLEIERASDLALRARETAARHELSNSEAYAKVQFAGILALRGDWSVAEDALADVLASSTGAEMFAKMNLGGLLAPSGRRGARTVVYRAWSLAQETTRLQHLVPAAARVAEYLWLSGEDDPALIEASLHALAAIEQLGEPQEPLSTGALAFWLWKLGHLSSIPDWIAAPYRLVMTGEHGEAAAIWEKKGVPYEQALALMHGDQTDQLRALRILEELGASATAARVRRSLLDAGVRAPRGKASTTRDHPAGLTARQAEVLDLLAEGLTNTQIADRLFISGHTVENHVAAILLKLEVTDRRTAGDAARSRGLLASAGPESQK